VSKVNDIKNMKRQHKQISPAQALAAEIGEENPQTKNNVVSKEENNKTKKDGKSIERKRVSFDLRIDLHKELKMQALIQDEKIYIMVEEALEKYLKERK
jgi:DNA-nicking Smr family endonuclease